MGRVYSKIIKKPSSPSLRQPCYINSLLVPKILSKIFSYLGLQDLMQCRRVNRLWENILNTHLQKRVKVTLRTQSDLQRYLEENTSYRRNRDKENFPCHSFTLHLNENLIQDTEKLGLFFETFGITMQELTVVMWNLNCEKSENSTKDIPFLFAEQVAESTGINSMEIIETPEIIFSINFDILPWVVDYNISNLIKVKSSISLLPNLKRFALSDQSTRINSLFPVHMLKKQFSTDYTILRFLTTLELKNPLRNKDLKFLTDTNIQLKKFSVALEYGVNPNLLLPLLEGMNKTINSLCIYARPIWCRKFEPNLSLPYLPFLKYLSVNFTMISDETFQKVPSVQYLTLDCNKFENLTELYRKPVIPATGVQLYSLIFRRKRHEIACMPVEIIRRFSDFKIRRIEIFGEDDVLLEIYKSFPELEELSIFVNRWLSGIGFTGIDRIEAEIEKEKLLTTGLSKSTEANSKLSQRLWKAGFIGRLTKLWKLELISSNQCHENLKYTDQETAFLLGICQCKAISNLHIQIPLGETSVRSLRTLGNLRTIQLTTKLGLDSKHRYVQTSSKTKVPKVLSLRWYQKLLITNPALNIFVQRRPGCHRSIEKITRNEKYPKHEVFTTVSV